MPIWSDNLGSPKSWADAWACVKASCTAFTLGSTWSVVVVSVTSTSSVPSGVSTSASAVSVSVVSVSVVSVSVVSVSVSSFLSAWSLLRIISTYFL